MANRSFDSRRGLTTSPYIAVVVTVLIVASLALSAQSSTPNDQAAADAASKRAADRIRALQKESDALASQERTLLVELRKLEVDRELKTEELANAERELRQTRERVAVTSVRAAALQNSAETERPEVERRLVDLYKLGQAGYWRLLLDVDNLRSIGRVYRTAAALNRLDRERVQQHERTLQALKQERESLEGHIREVSKLQAQALAAKAAIDRAVAARTALVASIDDRRDLNAQLTGELEAAQQRLQGTVTQLGGRGGAVALPIAPFRGALPWPAHGIVTGRFGRQTNSRFGTSIARSGIEISLAEGEPVRVVHEGTIAYADQFTGYGTLVIVDHGDSNYSLYGHLSSIDVARGSHVDAQAQLGSSGRDPSGNPALYFELRIDGKPVDPLQWLKK
ncbi:MAG TPA: peptidoglycan DD-metalloendopeptidase family protein [Vicinamibacterales bacterium]|jgi:murein hydrolase activator|nr:peptidoglycan DD-metalloendopeptidase family protein [Vicinamibacterales bacterium]